MLSTAKVANLVASFIEGHMSLTSVVLTLARLGGRAADSSRSVLPLRKGTSACGSVWVTSSWMGLSLYSRFGASQKRLLVMPMSIRRFLFAVNGSTLSTWCGIPSRFNVREMARRSGWCWFTYTPALGQMLACRVSTWTVSQQGYLIATCSSIHTKRLLMPTNSAAGMTRSESVGLAQKHAVAPAPCRLL